ncbi:mutator type transposase [Tanacetum coccineum]
MNNMKFQIDEEDESSGNDPVVPNVNVREDNLEVLDFDSLESDLEDVPKNARILGLRKLKKKHSSSKFFIGREFANRDLAKDLIRSHAVKSRRNLDFLRNDKRRIRVVCNGVVLSKNAIINKVQGPVVDISGKGKIVNEDVEEDKSGCPLLLYLSKGDKGKWVIKIFKDEHKCLQSRKIKYCTSSFLSKHIADLIILNPHMPIKAIQEQMQKKFNVSISKDKAFRAKAKAQLKRCNPDTTVKIDVYGEEDPKTPTRMFRRIYVCLGALKRGFREGGKELLGLDGAFMRGQYPGQMLTVVGVDANNGIYPVAYGIVESENQYSWTWFLKCRAHCDLLINNVCEVFNRQLLDARDSPIITALEYVREYLMKRIVIVQKVIQKCDGPLTPAVAKLFDKIKAASTGCTVEWNGSELYQVKGSHLEQYVVNLTQKTCSCRKWEISGIPCKHAIAAIHDMTDNGFDVGIPEDWVHDSYKLQTWMNVYSHKVNPVNGRDMWSKFDCPTTLLPPTVHPQIGRPPKKRKKIKGEIVMIKGNKLTRKLPNKTTGTKRTSIVSGTSIAVGTSIAAAKVGTQDSQVGTQASTGSTFKRTKNSASRLTPQK